MNTMTVLLPRASTGVPGLDDVLGGGFARNRLHLLEGSPGTGKTTIALQFLMAGAAVGERGIYVSLAETEEELRDGAKSHGWHIGSEITVFELVPPESVLDQEQHQSLLYSSDLELGETITRILDTIEKVKPKRVVIDSLSEIRLLAQSSLRYRRQILALKHYFARHQSTVIMLDDLTSESTDRAVHSIAHSVIHLDQLAPVYGGERRRLRVVKCRGQAFRSGYHDFTIATGGVGVFPRLVAAEHRQAFVDEFLKSDINALDSLLGGGVAAGSSTLVLGPAGTGKSLLILQYLAAAVKRGEKAALMVFDEELGLLFARAKGLGIDLKAMCDTGKLIVEQVDAAELTPGEFSHRVRSWVDKENTKVVAIDSLNGYQAAMSEEQFITATHPRAHTVPEPARRCDIPQHRPERHDGRHAAAGRYHLPRRHRHLAPLFRSLRPRAPGNLSRQETDRRARRHHPRAEDLELGPEPRPAIAGIPGRPARRPHFRRATRPSRGQPVKKFQPAERALVLASHGRDAAIARQILRESRIDAYVCKDVHDLLDQLMAGADLAIVTEESIVLADTRPLRDWVASQPPWSDYPFILLTRHGGGLERNPTAVSLTETFGNVAFLERPFHPTTLVSVVQTALRGRRRQYECRRLAEELEARVQERTEELAAANRQLLSQIEEREKVESTLRQMQRLEAVGQLTSGVAHDFNNLLTVLLGNISFLEKSLRQSGIDGKALQRLSYMREAAQRGARVTDQLLTFSRRQHLDPAPTDLKAVVSKLKDLLQSTMGTKIQIDTLLSSDACIAMVDHTQLELAILNLAINARDAMNGGGKLQVATKSVTLGEPTAPEEPPAGEYMEICVSDTGHGMTGEVRAKVFEPFFTTKEIGKGSGLGLSQVLGFAKQSGGGVSIETEPNKGTAIRIYLPPADELRAEISPEALAPISAHLSNATILLVDDDTAVRDVTATYLRDMGYRVMEAGSGGAALEVLESPANIDLLLFDFAMPGMNGAELARQARTRRPKLPVLFVTGLAEKDAFNEVSERSVIRKPINVHELSSKVQASLSLKASTAHGRA